MLTRKIKIFFNALGTQRKKLLNDFFLWSPANPKSLPFFGFVVVNGELGWLNAYYKALSLLTFLGDSHRICYQD
jgi:hypothetical protein